MAIRTRLQPIDKDISLFLREMSPQKQSQMLAQFAAEQITEAKETNRKILGRTPPYHTFVDGRKDVPLDTVKPSGIIVAEFELVTEALEWIADQLWKHSPVLTGRYREAHTLLADGVEVNLAGVIPPAEEYVFINPLPYSRKIERGSSSQAPDGVYQAVAVLASRRFGNVARITFSYRTVLGGKLIGGKAGDRSSERNPAIIVRLGGR